MQGSPTPRQLVCCKGCFCGWIAGEGRCELVGHGSARAVRLSAERPLLPWFDTGVDSDCSAAHAATLQVTH